MCEHETDGTKHDAQFFNVTVRAPRPLHVLNGLGPNMPKETLQKRVGRNAQEAKKGIGQKAWEAKGIACGCHASGRASTGQGGLANV